MSALTENSAAATAIRPFTVPVTSEAELEALRARVAATRWPDQELVADHSQGPKLAVMQELARYWATDYDWRRCEAKLNALPHFMTEIDGLDIHFIHVRSEHENALPVIITCMYGGPGQRVAAAAFSFGSSSDHANGQRRGTANPRAWAFAVVPEVWPGYQQDQEFCQVRPPSEVCKVALPSTSQPWLGSLKASNAGVLAPSAEGSRTW